MKINYERHRDFRDWVYNMKDAGVDRDCRRTMIERNVFFEDRGNVLGPFSEPVNLLMHVGGASSLVVGWQMGNKPMMIISGLSLAGFGAYHYLMMYLNARNQRFMERAAKTAHNMDYARKRGHVEEEAEEFTSDKLRW